MAGTKTRLDVQTAAATWLGDTSFAVWSAAELNSYIQEGYNDLVYRTLLIWKKSNTAFTLVAGTASYTLPTDFLKMDRITFNKRRLKPLHMEELWRTDATFLTQQGDVTGYYMDGLGYSSINFYRVPSVAGTSYTSIEYFRRGATLSADGTVLEIPDHYVEYVKWFVLHKALERDGPGQDVKLSQHFRERYEEGVQTIKRRKGRMNASRVGSFGGPGLSKQAPPLPQMPWNFGRIVRGR